MKVLIIGSNYDWSIERIYKKELEKLGVEVHLIETQNLFYNYYYKGIWNKICFRSGLSSIYRKINDLVIDFTKRQNYDLIWVFKGMELYPATINKLKNQSTRIINFNPDNPFVFSGKGSGNSNVRNSINLFDEHFTYDYNVKLQFEKSSKVKCSIVPFGFDEEIISELEVSIHQEINAVCFLGNPDSYRAKVLKEVLNMGLSLHVYGNHWEKFLSHPLLTIHKPVIGKSFYQTLRNYRVQLNIMRIHNPDSHNMRSIEIPGCGGIMLAPKTLDHVHFFEEGKEAFFYTNTESLVNQAKKILEMDSRKINEIRIAAREKVLSEFSYSKLVQKIIS